MAAREMVEVGSAVERASVGERWIGRGFVILSGLGVAVSGYLTAVHFSGGLALCTGAGGCEQVQASRFAKVGDAPVALFGLAMYLALLALSLWRARAAAATPSGVVLALFGLGLAVVLYTAYLTYLELFVIGAICPWCVSSAVMVVGVFALAAWDLARG